MNVLRNLIVRCLVDRGECTSVFLSSHLRAPLEDIRTEIAELISNGLVEPRCNEPYYAGPLPTYKLLEESIGECELCGVVDHHRVQGVCPSCRTRCVTVCPPALALSARVRRAIGELAGAASLALQNLDIPDEPALGAEADVRHAVGSKERR